MSLWMKSKNGWNLWILKICKIKGSFFPKERKSFLCVSGMTRFLLVQVQPQVVTAKCSEPQAEGREAQVKEVV